MSVTECCICDNNLLLIKKKFLNSIRAFLARPMKYAVRAGHVLKEMFETRAYLMKDMRRLFDSKLSDESCTMISNAFGSFADEFVKGDVAFNCKFATPKWEDMSGCV